MSPSRRMCSSSSRKKSTKGKRQEEERCLQERLDAAAPALAAFCSGELVAPPEVLRSLFLSSGGLFFCFRTGFRPGFCRGSAQIAPPAGFRPAGGAIFALPRQKSGRKPVRKHKNRPPELKNKLRRTSGIREAIVAHTGCPSAIWPYLFGCF